MAIYSMKTVKREMKDDKNEKASSDRLRTRKRMKKRKSRRKSIRLRNLSEKLMKK